MPVSIMARVVLALCIIWLSQIAVADGVTFDFAIEWQPGTYTFTQRSTNELEFDGQSQLFDAEGQLRLTISKSGNQTRYGVAFQPHHASLDGIEHSMPAIPELAIVMDSEGRVLEVENQANTALTGNTSGLMADALIGHVMTQFGVGKQQVRKGEQWSQKQGERVVQWSLDQVGALTQVADLSFRYLGGSPVPDSHLLRALGVDFAPKINNVAGQMRVDTANNRLLQVTSRASLVFDLNLPGELDFQSVKITQTQYMELVSFDEDVL